MRVILNPRARHGAGGRARALIERELTRRGLDYELVLTEGPGHAKELARDAVRHGVTRIVAAGGDGTVHEVVNGVLAAPYAETAVGLIPIGTGNDFVKIVPGTATLAEAFITLAEGTTTRVDVGHAEWDDVGEYFINAMGTGIDVAVVRQMRRSRLLPGAVIYVSALIRALLRYQPMAVRVDIEGATLRRRIMNLAVCNGPSIGGSFRICPDALTDDGIFDVCLVEEMSLLRNARMVPRVISGTHTTAPGVTMMRGAEIAVRLEEPGPLWFQLDGELRQARDGVAGVRIRVAPAHLHVIRSPAREPVTNG